MSAVIYVSPRDAVIGADPCWHAIGSRPVHDWRSHVPEQVRAVWTSFNADQRAALVEWAEGLANAENWD